MQRDMSYDLDDAFSARDAGEVQQLPVAKTKVLRTPGLAPVMDPNEVTALRDAEPTRPATELSGGLEIDVPVIGKINLLHVGLAVGATLLICKLLKKKG